MLSNRVFSLNGETNLIVFLFVSCFLKSLDIRLMLEWYPTVPRLILDWCPIDARALYPQKSSQPSQSLQCCPFDPTSINHDFPENEAIFSLLPINSANLLGSYLSTIAASNHEKLVNCFHLSKDDLKNYCLAIDCIQSLAQLIKPQNSCKWSPSDFKVIT